MSDEIVCIFPIRNFFSSISYVNVLPNLSIENIPYEDEESSFSKKNISVVIIKSIDFSLIENKITIQPETFSFCRKTAEKVVTLLRLLNKEFIWFDKLLFYYNNELISENPMPYNCSILPSDHTPQENKGVYIFNEEINDMLQSIKNEYFSTYDNFIGSYQMFNKSYHEPDMFFAFMMIFIAIESIYLDNSTNGRKKLNHAIYFLFKNYYNVLPPMRAGFTVDKYYNLRNSIFHTGKERGSDIIETVDVIKLQELFRKSQYHFLKNGIITEKDKKNYFDYDKFSSCSIYLDKEYAKKLTTLSKVNKGEYTNRLKTLLDELWNERSKAN